MNRDKKLINDVPLREANSREEKLLLGFIHQESERIGFGEFDFKVKVYNGKIVHIQSTGVARTFKVGNP